MFPSPSAMWDCARAFADVGELLFYFLHRETTDCLFASQCRLKTFFLPFRLNPQSIPSLRKRLGRVPTPRETLRALFIRLLRLRVQQDVRAEPKVVCQGG